MTRPVSYHSLLAHLQDAGLLSSPPPDYGPPIRDITCDSRTAGPESCFVAIKGSTRDGRSFAEAALQRGARVIISEASLPPAAATHIQVTDARAALAVCAAQLMRHPADNVRCIGITGTNGKTTTAWLLRHVLESCGYKSGLIGTISYGWGLIRKEAPLTTPDAPTLQRMLRDMVDAGCQWCVMEVSSHALDQHRIGGIAMRAGVFTNLQRDHLDYHKTTAAYARAKKRLFDGLPAKAIAVINADDDAASTMMHSTRARVIRFGQHSGADMRFEVVNNAPTGLHMRLNGVDLKTHLCGRFNAYNIAAACATGCALGMPMREVLEALSSAKAPPGRFEPVPAPGGALAIVDYAHTPDALKQALLAVRQCFPERKVWCVFGCGGDRDRSKRPLMGAIAERYADKVIITSDNTRSETYEAIGLDIRHGMRNPESALWIEDRQEAINNANLYASSREVILVAGKGHETVQVAGNRTRPMNDRAMVQASAAPGKQHSDGCSASQVPD